MSEQQSKRLVCFCLFSSNSAKLFFLFIRRLFIRYVKMFGCGLEMISSPLHETPTTFIDFDHFSPLRRFLIQYKNVWTQWTHLCIELFILPKEIDTQLSQSDIDFLVEYYDFIVEYLIWIAKWNLQRQFCLYMSFIGYSGTPIRSSASNIYKQVLPFWSNVIGF